MMVSYQYISRLKYILCNLIFDVFIKTSSFSLIRKLWERIHLQNYKGAGINERKRNVKCKKSIR